MDLLPFEGVRILDFTQLIAGPFATYQMALMGADVIKVERLGAGDQFTHTMHTERSRPTGRAFPFQAANHNKRSLAIDLQQDGAVDIIRNIAKSCDAVIENFAAGVINRLGLGYDDICKLNPEIVYCSISGYGQSGPKAGMPAYDAAIQAASGMMSITGDQTSGPMRAGYQSVDIPTAIMAALALSAGLYRRLRTGKGQYIDVSMMDTAVLLQMPSFVTYMNGGATPSLLGNRSIANNPTSDAFATSDGYVLVTTLHEKHVEELFKALGISEVYNNALYSTDEQRKANSETLRPLLSKAFANDTAANWSAWLSRAGIGIAAVTSIPDVVKDPQFDHRPLFAKVAMAGSVDQEMTTLVSSFKTSTKMPTVSAAPTLGQHTDGILNEFGYTAADIEKFRARSII